MKTAQVALLVLLGSGLVFAGTHTLSPDEKAVVAYWLRSHPTYRLAVDEDCECRADIQTMRKGQGGIWKAVPDYHPYAVRGDFNGDGTSDFAVAVVDRTKTADNFTLLVFNGPFSSHRVSPAFVERDVSLRHTGLFFGAPRSKPYRLVIGEFESEGMILVPRGKSYRYKAVSPVGE